MCINIMALLGGQLLLPIYPEDMPHGAKMMMYCRIRAPTIPSNLLHNLCKGHTLCSVVPVPCGRCSFDNMWPTQNARKHEYVLNEIAATYDAKLW